MSSERIIKVGSYLMVLALLVLLGTAAVWIVDEYYMAGDLYEAGVATALWLSIVGMLVLQWGLGHEKT